MKRVLGIFSISLALLLGGCTVAPQPAAQGPAGQPGPAGQTGAAGAAGDTGQAGQAGDKGQIGQAGQTGDTGQKGDTGDRGKPAPCPAGQHRTTSEAGIVSCIAD